MKAHQRLALLGLISLGAGSFSSCVTTQIKQNQLQQPESDWVLPSRALNGDIQAQAEALPWTHGRERVDLISWFASVGEPAYDTLLGFLTDERAEVIGTALAALGATGDPRLVSYLRNAERPEWTGNLLLEFARTRVRLGDWDAMPPLIDGLESEEMFVRSLCAQSLFEATSESHGYDSRAALPEREAAVSRWRSWWDRRSKDELLVGQL
jgi:hypothetical protein